MGEVYIVLDGFAPSNAGSHCSKSRSLEGGASDVIDHVRPDDRHPAAAVARGNAPGACDAVARESVPVEDAGSLVQTLTSAVRLRESQVSGRGGGGGGGGGREVEQFSRTTVEPLIKDAPNKGHLRIKDTIQSTKKSLSYSASTFLTSE